MKKRLLFGIQSIALSDDNTFITSIGSPLFAVAHLALPHAERDAASLEVILEAVADNEHVLIRREGGEEEGGCGGGRRRSCILALPQSQPHREAAALELAAVAVVK